MRGREIQTIDEEENKTKVVDVVKACIDRLKSQPIADFQKSNLARFIVELLPGIIDNPDQGSPYVVWGSVPYAHIKVPVGNSSDG